MCMCVCVYVRANMWPKAGHEFTPHNPTHPWLIPFHVVVESVLSNILLVNIVSYNDQLGIHDANEIILINDFECQRQIRGAS